MKGANIMVILYDPRGNIFTTVKGMTDGHGEARFEIYVGPEALPGIYTLIPKVSVEGSPILIGGGVSFKVF